MTSNFKIIDFKNLSKKDINGFLNEKADDVWQDNKLVFEQKIQILKKRI